VLERTAVWVIGIAAFALAISPLAISPFGCHAAGTHAPSSGAAGASAGASVGSGDAGSGGAGAGGASAPQLDGLTSIKVSPATASVTIANGQPATQAFTATGVFADGHTADVTAAVTWSTNDYLRARTAANGVVTTGTSAGGQVLVTAGGGGVQGSATLTIRMQVVAKNTAGTPATAPPLPASPQGAFTGASDPARAPQLVYPNDGVLLPPNLGSIEVHFRPGSASNALYEIAFTNDVTDVRVYTRCAPLADGCLYTTSPEVWSALASTNRGGAAVTLTVRGTTDASAPTAAGAPAGVGASAPFKLRWSRDPLQGALYYWTTTTPVGVMRWNFGDATQTSAEPVVGATAGDGKCLGCHALSRDGSKMIMTSGNADVGQMLLFDPVKKAALRPFPVPGRSWFESWSPDGSQFVGVDGGDGFKDLLLFDGVTGAQTGTIPLGGAEADHPDWSPDGRRILFTEVGEPHNDQKPGRGGISYVERPPGGAWSAPTRLVPSQAGLNRYYPTVAADSATVVFDQSTCPAGKTYDDSCDATADPSARLYAAVIGAASGAAPVELAAANAPGVADGTATDLTSSYPRWSPFQFVLSEERRLYWVSFSSSRQYGLRAPVTGGDHLGNPTGLLIWMSGIDPSEVAAGRDGSFAPFCLPFQALATSNHIPQWTSGVPFVQ
jgi:hypothetical protein